mgnify:CR=1 FL=1
MSASTSQNQHIAVVGLGSMGFGMATSLKRAGHAVTAVYLFLVFQAARLCLAIVVGPYEALTPEIAATSIANRHSSPHLAT